MTSLRRWTLSAVFCALASSVPSTSAGLPEHDAGELRRAVPVWQAVFDAVLSRYRHEVPPSPCIGLSVQTGTGYGDPPADLVRRLRRKFPEVRAASECSEEWELALDRVRWRPGGGADVGWIFTGIGRSARDCPYRVSHRLFQGWRARPGRCPGR